MSSTRGLIRHRDRRRQIVDMRGLTFGTITPTDLDALIDYHNDAFAFVELKHRGTALERGQKVALVRVVDLVAQAGKRAALFVAEHAVDNPARDIDAARCRVRAIYEARAWREPDEILTLRDGLDQFLAYGPGRATYQPYQPSRPARAAVAVACVHKAEFIVDGRCWVCEHSQ